MKKLLISLSLLSLMSSVYATDTTSAKSGIVFQGQVSANFTPDQTLDGVNNNSHFISSPETYNGGLGGALFVGYDYAINSNMTVGGKVGYQYVYTVNEYQASSVFGNDPDIKLNMNNIPVLATFKYIFNSGWLLGAEGGIDIQKWTLKRDGNNGYINEYMDYSTSYSSNWNIAPMIGLSGGYQFSFGLAVTGNVDYVFGKSTDDITSVSENDALAYYSIGLNVSYTLPI
ncbi:MAG: hypothetical protein EP298_07025 [Gammaproteobacteria bacterium]|nr:MAG: hypothetical protein EP298_07025 [Gammaproteobacteria bacterium]UTW42987.1 hypothetical protein KFE69_02265 [bacterium SCSIO 12844]